MTSQYALRFESTERRGEQIPLSAVAGRGGVFTIGRGPGNSLQVTDASVSGRHAEISIPSGGAGVFIRDLGSTNGTQVGGRRVTEATLAEGDEFTLGAVQFSLIDLAPRRTVDGEIELEEASVLPSASSPAGRGGSLSGLGETRIQPRDEALEISAADLARSKRSSRSGLLALGVLAAAAVGAFVWSRGAGDEGDGPSPAAASKVDPPAGDLLGAADHSFEGGRGGSAWTLEGELLAPFERRSSAAASGRRGLRAELGPGGEARAVSPAVDVPSGPVRASAAARVASADVEARLALVYAFDGEDAAPVVALSAPAAPGGDDFQTLVLESVPPVGARSVTLELRARSLVAEPEGEGPEEDAEGQGLELEAVDFDDAVLVPAGADAPFSALVGAWTVSALAADGGGEGSSVLTLGFAWREQVHSPGLTHVDASGRAAAMQVTEDEDSILLAAATGTEGRFLVEREFALQGVTTMGPGGASTHGITFERESCTALVVGAGQAALCLRFGDATTVSAREANGRVLFRWATAPGATTTVQLGFAEERAAAARLARRAREEMKAGRPGAAHRVWGELLDRVPFVESLVDEAITAQGRIDDEARERLMALATEVERARFFQLGDLYREKLAEADELAATYAGTSAEAELEALRGALSTEIDRLSTDSVKDEERRLMGIAAALRARGSTELASEVSAGADATNEEGQ